MDKTKHDKALSGRPIAKKIVSKAQRFAGRLRRPFAHPGWIT